MDKRTAKQIVCYRAALQLLSDIDGGGHETITGTTDRDHERIEEATRELYEELMRRAGPALDEWMGGDDYTPEYVKGRR